jgi:hypothetical protein
MEGQADGDQAISDVLDPLRYSAVAITPPSGTHAGAPLLFSQESMAILTKTLHPRLACIGCRLLFRQSHAGDSAIEGLFDQRGARSRH